MVDFSDDGETGATLGAGGTTAVVRARDGGRGDSDGAADGAVKIVVVPVVPASSCPSNTASFGGGAGGSGGGSGGWSGGTAVGPVGAIVTVPGGPYPGSFGLCVSDLASAGVAIGSVIEFNLTFPRQVQRIEIPQITVGPSGSTMEFVPFTDDGETGAVLSADGMSAVVRVRDGGRGDSDQSANGQACANLLFGGDLQITTETLPDAVVGTAYSVQLEATGSDGPLTWNMVGGPPSPWALTAAGILAATPQQEWSGSILLNVTDGAWTSFANLTLTVSEPGKGPVSHGGTLPEGSYLDVLAGPLMGSTFSKTRLAADGSVTSTPYPITSEPTPSPDGTKVAVWSTSEADGTRVVVYDNTMAVILREYGFDDNPTLSSWRGGGGLGGIVWSPDSSEIAVGTHAVGTTIDVTVISALDASGASDRTVTIGVAPIQANEFGAYNPVKVVGWSATGRLAILRYRATPNMNQMMVGYDIYTADAGDGGDVRLIRPAMTSILGYASVVFSPTGGNLAFSPLPIPAGPDSTHIGIAVASDVEAAPVRVLDLGPGDPFGVLIPLAWR